MRSLLLLLFCFIVISSVSARKPSGANEVLTTPPQGRLALVIGNDHYDDKVHFPALKVCRNDADSMTSVLKRCGFTVITCKDAGKKMIMEYIGKFVSMLPENDVALVYYSGHGTEVDNKNYILPSDIMNPRKSNEVLRLMFKNSAIDIQSTILSEFNKRQNKINFLIMDACRINLDDFLPGSKSPKPDVEAFTKPEQHEGTTIVFATGSRQKSFESKGNNSVFTNELLKQITIPNLSYRDVFMNAAQGTIDLVSQFPSDYAGLQQPQIIDMIPGKFVFIADETKKAVPEIHSLSRPDVVIKPSGVPSDAVLTRFQKADFTYGYQDPTRKIVIPAKFEYADECFHDGLAFVATNNKYGYIDKQGTVVIPCQFEKAYSFSDGLALVYKNGKYGYVNTNGEIAIDFQFASAGSFSDGLAVVKLGSKYGYIDKDERLAINYEFEEAGSFYNDRACVKIRGRYGYIDKQGKVVIQPQFETLEAFHDGAAKVKIEDRVLLINTCGAILKDGFETYRY